MEVGTFNHHVLMLLSAQLGQFKVPAGLVPAATFQMTTVLCVSALGAEQSWQKGDSNGPLEWVKPWGSCTEPLLSALQ